jgi:hypothetical protein
MCAEGGPSQAYLILSHCARLRILSQNRHRVTRAGTDRLRWNGAFAERKYEVLGKIKIGYVRVLVMLQMRVNDTKRH